MEVLEQTVLLDDGCSPRFHHGLSLLTDFIHNAQVAPSANTTPFQLRLLIQQMHLFLLDSSSRPLFRLMFNLFDLRQENRLSFSKTALFIDYLNFSYFLPDSLTEHHLLGHVLKPFQHALPPDCSINHFISPSQFQHQSTEQHNLQFEYTTMPQEDFVDKDLFV